MNSKNPIVDSHPWIDFMFDLRELDFRTWIALGECASMCTHIAQIPLSPEVSQELHKVYLVKGVLATTAIEGNTLSEEEVRKAVEGTLELPKSKAYLGKEVDNIIAAFNTIGKEIRSGKIAEITPETLCEYNGQILSGLTVEEGVMAGRFRQHSVTVGKYRCPPAKHSSELVRLLCERLKSFEEDPETFDPIVKAVLKAIFAHLYVAWIHPFGDGNGCTARLLEANILLRSGVPSLAAHLLSNHYNATRSEYYRMLDLASRGRDFLGFVSYAIKGFRDGLREQRKAIMTHIRDVVWINYVHEQFKGKWPSAMSKRQPDLVLELSKYGEPATLDEIPTITPTLRKLYGRMSLQTVRRDVKVLLDMKLLHMIRIERLEVYVPNRDLIDSLLPISREAN